MPLYERLSEAHTRSHRPSQVLGRPSTILRGKNNYKWNKKASERNSGKQNSYSKFPSFHNFLFPPPCFS